MQRFFFLRQQNTPDLPFIETVKTGTIDTEDTNTIKISAVSEFKRPNVMDIILFLLPLFALFLWSTSLQKVSLNSMNDLGLMSVLSPRIIATVGILVVSYTFTLQRKEIRILLLALQLVCLIVVIYGTPSLIEEMSSGPVAFRHAGYTEYIMRTGTVDPYLDIYFDFPSFFVLSAFFTKAFGYSTILSYAGWAPIFNNLIYFGPMYMIFTSIITHKRLVWLSLLFFYLTKWIGQDYFSPQGLDYFLYLVIIAILLKWFRVPGKMQTLPRKNTSFRQKLLAWLNTPEPQPLANIGIWRQRGLLCCLIAIFGLVVSSHPLTPFFTLLSVTALVLFRRCYPFWLPILMAIMIAAWMLIMARPYLSQHPNEVMSSLGDLTGNIPTSITTGKMIVSPLYQIIARTRLSLTLLFWLFAFLGSMKRLWQGHRDLTFILIALAGFPLIAIQKYGGEMPMRIYLFSEPIMAFFAAALFCDDAIVMTAHTYPKSLLRKAAIIATNLILLGSFLFARYGDERVNYITYAEWNAVQYIYQIAPAKSLIVDVSDNTPMYFENYEKYQIQSLMYVLPEEVTATDANAVTQFFEDEHNPHSYLLFSQEQQNRLTVWEGRLPGNILQRLEARLLQTGKFKIIYRNTDTQILQFIG